MTATVVVIRETTTERLLEAERALTLERQAETDSLREYANRMAELDRLKSDFMKLVSHELRGPVAVLGGYVSMIEDRTLGEPTAELDAVLPTLRGQILLINMLVEEMLVAARLEDDKLEMRYADIDVRLAVAEVVERMRPLAPPGAGVRLTVPTEPVMIRADTFRLQTVVGNLIDNAIKFSEAAGPVRCDVRRTASAVEIEIADKGLGIAPEDIDRLFTKFGRIVTPENSHIQGTGLGLYIAREVVRKHGGDISVRSVLGSGSTFIVALPAPVAVPDTATITSGRTASRPTAAMASCSRASSGRPGRTTMRPGPGTTTASTISNPT